MRAPRTAAATHRAPLLVVEKLRQLHALAFCQQRLGDLKEEKRRGEEARGNRPRTEKNHGAAPGNRLGSLPPPCELQGDKEMDWPIQGAAAATEPPRIGEERAHAHDPRAGRRAT